MSDDGRSSLRHGVFHSAGVLLVIGLLLVSATGAWPPLVAVESGSMGPHIERGDLVVVTEPGRWALTGATNAPDSGIVTAQTADGARMLGEPGDILVFDTPAWDGPPIVHRAMFHVSAGEDWYDEANQSWLPPGVDDCADLRNCPAPNDGYITKGDANPYYDQARGRVVPVREEWVRAKAAVRLSDLGWFRLFLTGKAHLPFVPL